MTKSAHGEGADSVAGRLERILDGRKPYPWAQSVALSRGAMARLLRGSFPDPEKLVPACRVENLSLSWFVAGQGQPYLVHAHSTDDECAHTVRAHLTDEPGWHVLVLRSSIGWVPVLHQHVETATADGQRYSYRAVEVIAGPAADRTAQVLVAPPSDRSYMDGVDSEIAGRTTYTTVDDETFQAVVGGRIGTHALFGTDATVSGIASRAQHVLTAGYPTYWKSFALVWPSVAEQDSLTWLTAQQRELLANYSKLGESDRETVLRMVRGLSTVF